jgi:thiamine-monophosphate kinase
MFSERQLIERAWRILPTRGGTDLRVGIGDDAAVIRPRGGADWVFTTDGFLENAHFLACFHPPDAVGYKALARATSDLAAMGATPRYFLLSLALPEARTGVWLDKFLLGMARAARRFGLDLVGGDTTRYLNVAINLTVLGQIARGRAVLRSGARPEDLLCVSGTLGEAELGLRILLRGLHKQKQSYNMLRRHFLPEPRLALGQWLARNRLATAMIDLSDGLSTDLGHLCEASGVGAQVWSEKIPKPRIPASLWKLKVDPLALALHGGDDYELLFTVPPRAARRLPAAFRGLPITVIGKVTRKRETRLIHPAGRSRFLPPRGWDPFRRRG